MRPLIRDEIRRGYYDAINSIPPKTDYRFPAYTVGHWFGRWSVRIGFFG